MSALARLGFLDARTERISFTSWDDFMKQVLGSSNYEKVISSALNVDMKAEEVGDVVEALKW